MLIAPAFAQGIGPGGGFDLMSFAPILAIVVVFYFMLFRPQQKKAKQHREMLAAVKRGDRIVTAGGIIGTVTKVLNDAELTVEIAEGVRVRVVRATITDILAKTEPRSSSTDDGDAAPEKPKKPTSKDD